MSIIKSFSLFFTLISVNAHVIRRSTTPHWNYQNVANWGRVSKTCVEGKRQSPINLELKETRYSDPKDPIVQIYNYNVFAKTTLSNNGHTVELVPDYKDRRPSITGPALNNKKYALKNIHLHWGTHNQLGSEHSFSGYKYAAELHLVHYNTAYHTFEKAVSQKDGLAVLAVIFIVDDSMFPSASALFLQHLLTTYSVNNPGSKKNLSNFKIEALQPKMRRLFIYDGSLTTPPCTENVRWLVQVDPEVMSSEIMSQLRQISLNDNDKQNFRLLQDVNDRSIDYYQIVPLP